MGKHSRMKGARGEREVAELLRPLFPQAKRGVGQTQAGNTCADVEGTDFWLEVKRTEREAPRKALRQAIEATDGRPPVVFTRPNNGEWMVCMLAEDWMTLVDEARSAPALNLTWIGPTVPFAPGVHPSDINPEREQDCGNQRCDDA